MSQPLSFRWDPGFIARIDAARKTPLGEISRSAFVRDAVELAIRRAEAAQDMAEDPTGRHAREAMVLANSVQYVPGGHPRPCRGLCDHFIESGEWDVTYCKLPIGHDGPHAAHYPPERTPDAP